MSATCSTGVKINGNVSLTKVPFGFCQFTFPGTRCLQGRLLRSYLLDCHLFIQKRSVKPERERKRSAQVFLSVLLRWKNLVTLGPESYGAVFTGMRSALGKDVSLCRGIIVPCLLTKSYFLKPCLSHDLVRSGLPSSTDSGIL